jgi:flagellar protein FlgJ
LAALQQNTFLRVLDGGTSRLQAEAYDQDGNPAETGWIDVEDVLPSAPATNWLVSTTASTLWSAADSSASDMRSVEPFTPLQKADSAAGPLLSRILVRVYQPDFGGTPALGWVDVADVGPALPPRVHVPAALTDTTSGNRQATNVTQQQAFLAAAIPAARQAAAATQVPASVTVAQAILESDWGRSTLAQDANNFFGMKVMGTLGNDGVVWLPTSEYDSAGNLYQTSSAFRAYKSLADSIVDHDQLLEDAARYAPAMQATSDPRQFAALIAQEGYSSDPAYADKLVALMDRYDLYAFDSPV